MPHDDPLREASGVKHIVVTHAMMAPIHMSIPQMQEAAAMGPTSSLSITA